MTEVVMFARPGCPFCDRLRSGLGRAGLAYRERDIWQDPEAAAAVRAAADGNETVPTINVGGAWLVNPSVDEVLDAVAAEAPDLLPELHAGR
ncbi:NrdH-redoxin [Solihabitans fulvus]|uniref:NrdH-redoxin n=1 Tax=Solihabitans fulvus TaxID=1892852 RepID=A0A5B2X0K4_9PSEU|nr:glutaredoxin domain-containing protein [Solihabitans fulvus]KAA2256948.1 NrdH-redoxin [Solihabitans fulvus]